MNDRLISLNMAIDAAIKAADDWDGGTNIGRQKRIEKAIKALPPVQSEPKSYRMGFQAGYAAAQRWIPVTEKLPTENNSYLVWMPFAPKGHHITVAEWCGSYWNIKTPMDANSRILEKI